MTILQARCFVVPEWEEGRSCSRRRTR